MSQICFYLDEHVPSAVASALRRRNIQVVTVADAGLLAASDDVHLAYACRHGLVLFTQDEDFLGLVANDRNHRGIVYAPQGTSIGSIVTGLTLVFGVLSVAEMTGRVEFL